MGGSDKAGSIVALLTLLVVAMAGCVSDTAPRPLSDSSSIDGLDQVQVVRLLDDPIGDAREYNSEAVGILPYKCRAVGDRAWLACLDATRDVLPLVPGGAAGIPAPPALDGTVVSVWEDSENLRVELQVASLDERLTGAVAGDGSRWGLWAVCWRSEEEPQCAYLTAGMVGGKLVAYAEYDRYSETCLDWGFFGWCSWRIDHSVETGQPGVVGFTVPKTLLPGSGPLRLLEAVAFQTTSEPPLRMEGPAGYFHWGLEGPVEEFGKHDGAHNEYLVDWGVSESRYEVSIDQSLERSSQSLSYSEDDPTDEPRGRSEGEILGVELVEDEKGLLTVAVRMAEVLTNPSEHDLGITLGLPAARPLEAGYTVGPDGLAHSARVCGDADCSRWVPVPMQLSRQAGSPGWVNVTFERSDVMSPKAGDLIRLLMVYTNFPDARESRDAGLVRLEVVGGLGGDLTFGLPYWLRT